MRYKLITMGVKIVASLFVCVVISLCWMVMLTLQLDESIATFYNPLDTLENTPCTHTRGYSRSLEWTS